MGKDGLSDMKIKNAEVFDLERGFIKRDINFTNGVITENDEASHEVLDAEGLYAIPGLVDIHFHGCVGDDFCDGTEEAIRNMAEYELKQGVTGICPASMTFAEDTLKGIFQKAANYAKSNNPKGAQFLGINMEGPFICMEKKGAQNGEFIQKPDIGMFERLMEDSEGLIKLVDIAPEEDGAMEFIHALKDKVRISLAHTTADYDTARKAFEQGATHVTHLYNAMPPYHHRNPGVIGAACDCEDCMVELIADNVHIHPVAVRTTFKMFGKERIILISDSMRATGLKDGQYTLGGQDVTVCGNKAVLTKEGNIAGSVTNLFKCMKTAVQIMNIPLESAVRCASYNPAKAIGVEKDMGSLDIGKQANIILMDQDMNIKYIIYRGNVIE